MKSQLSHRRENEDGSETKVDVKYRGTSSCQHQIEISLLPKDDLNLV